MKQTFAANTFAANTFASGCWTGVGATAESTTQLDVQTLTEAEAESMTENQFATMRESPSQVSGYVEAMEVFAGGAVVGQVA